jgi:acyl-CoA synthetase (AMP-forming)/AMP-acid ligase II
LHKFSSHGLRRDALQVCYAMAENVFAVTQTPYGSIPKTLSADIEAFHKSEHIEEGNGIFFLSSGTPLSGIEVEISGKDGRLLPERQVGEVIFSSPCLFKGYYKLPELTSRKIKNGFYFSGDMGFMENGELYITGRKDDLLISYGKNVYAHSIEEIVNTVDGIIPGRNIAISVPNETTGTDDIIIICETSPPSDNRLKIKIKQGVFDCLDLMVSRIKLVEKGWLIKTTSGKISRNLNKEKFIKTMKGK